MKADNKKIGESAVNHLEIPFNGVTNVLTHFAKNDTGVCVDGFIEVYSGTAMVVERSAVIKFDKHVASRVFSPDELENLDSYMSTRSRRSASSWATSSRRSSWWPRRPPRR